MLMVIVLASLLPLMSARLDSLKTVDDYLNICLDGRNHKSAPGPEDELHQQVQPLHSFIVTFLWYWISLKSTSYVRILFRSPKFCLFCVFST